MDLRNTDSVVAARGRRLTDINAFVLKANIAFLRAVKTCGTLDSFTPDVRIA